MMTSLVLEAAGRLSLREFPLAETNAPLAPHDVRVAIKRVGICGSDIHYFQHGAIGPFVVREPMILGHEAAGIVLETGSAVTHLKAGDAVCMEPGIPSPHSRATQLGIYNLDPAVRFWATPPVHGCLRPTVVHPAAFTFKLPENISLAEGAMVEPLAVGMHAATRAGIKPGDVAVVTGAGPIGLVTIMSALAAGCSRVIVSDLQPAKLLLAASLGPVVPVNVREQRLADVVTAETNGWGADVVFECTGASQAVAGIFDLVCPGGKVVLVGMPGAPVSVDVVAAQIKEVRIETIFRYAHMFPRALALMGSGKIDVKPLITETFSFQDSIKAFDYAAAMPAASVKVQIELED